MVYCKEPLKYKMMVPFKGVIMSKGIDEVPLIKFSLDRNSKKSMYKQIYDSLRNAILDKSLEQGQKLPSTRSLATELKVSRNTVNLAFEQLTIEGYIKGTSGSGSFVNEIPDNYLIAKRKDPCNESRIRLIKHDKKFGSSELMNRTRKYKKIIPFQTGTPAIKEFPFTTWSKLINQTSREIKSSELGYLDAEGYLPLRTEIAKYLNNYRAVNCSADHILIVNGSQQGLDLIFRVILKPGSIVWLEDPGYYGTRASLILADSKIYPCKLDENGLDVKHAEENFPTPEIIYTTPSHQFPLGHTMNITRRLELLEFAKKHNVWIIEDDYDSEFRYFGKPLPALQGMDLDANVIYLGTFSKVLFPGLRIGYLVLPDTKIADIFAGVKSLFDRQSSIFEQIVLTRFIKEGYFTKHIRRMRLLYKERQEFLINEIERELKDILTVSKNPTGMHLIGYFEKGLKAKEISVEASNAGVILAPISDFSIKQKVNEAVLMGYSAFNEKELKKGIEKLKRVLLKHS